MRLTFDLPDERDMQGREGLEELPEMIFRLGRLDRALLLLWLEQRSYEEIAAILGISRENVAVRLNRIRCRLRKIGNHLNLNDMELEELKRAGSCSASGSNARR